MKTKIRSKESLILFFILDKVIYQERKKNKKDVTKKTKKMLKYGENPNQKSYFFKNQSISIPDCQIHGKKLSYNNILDISDGLNCINEFNEPTQKPFILIEAIPSPTIAKTSSSTSSGRASPIA